MDDNNLFFTEIDDRTKEQIRSLMVEMQDNRDAIKNTILAIIEELKTIVKTNDPILLLTHLANFINLQMPTEHYNFDEIPKLVCYLEYALNIIAAIDVEEVYIPPTPGAVEDFVIKIHQMFSLTQLYYNTEPRDAEETEKHIRVNSILQYILLRGHSYPKHHNNLFKALFEPHNDFFSRNFGFTVEECINNIKKLGQQFSNNFETYIRTLELIRQQGFQGSETLDEIEGVLKNIYKINLTTELDKNFLSLFSTKIGENSDFRNFNPLWPLNNSTIYTKPLIEKDGNYYSFGFKILSSNIIEILEDLIKSTSAHYFDRSYGLQRGRALEDLTIKYLQDIYPNSQIYSRLKYSLNEDSSKKPETDGLLLFDRTLFIIEAKANRYNLPARRGSIQSMKNYLKETVDKAYNQAIRTRKYILENEEANFEDENGNLVVLRRENFDQYILVNTTLEKLNHISSDLPEVRDLGLIQGNDWPWTVFINDLRVISEFIESPSIFLTYVLMRFDEYNRKKLMTSDEIDYFAYFLKDRMGFFEPKLETDVKVRIDQMSIKIDDYYYLNSPKLALNVPRIVKDIIIELDNVQKEGFSQACSELLYLSKCNLLSIADTIKNKRKMSRRKKRDKIVFYPNTKKKAIIVILVRKHSESKDYSSLKEELARKLNEDEQIDKFILLVDGIENGNNFWNFVLKK